MRICVLIPCYDVESVIGGVVKEIKNAGLDVVVIDDGSTDETEKRASEHGALVMRHVKNLGKGASLREGFDFVVRMTNFEAVIVMDGDGQHSPGDIQKFISHASRHADDIIVGNRMDLTKNMPFVRLATNRFMSSLLSVMCKQRIPDTQCGFRFIRRRVLEEIKFESDKYDIDSELLIKASRKGMKISSVPIKTIYGEEVSGIRPVRDALRFIGLLLKTYFNRG